MIRTFTALDVETATPSPESICQIGLVRVEEGIVVKKLELLVRPPGNEYYAPFIQIHGIEPSHTGSVPEFPKIWTEVRDLIIGQDVVAHNMKFDERCLLGTMAYYGMELPDFRRHCTYLIYRKRLSVLCEEHGIPLDHHNALSDAMACARLFMCSKG